MYDELMDDFENVRKKWRSCQRKAIGVLEETHEDEDTEVWQEELKLEIDYVSETESSGDDDWMSAKKEKPPKDDKSRAVSCLVVSK